MQPSRLDSHIRHCSLTEPDSMEVNDLYERYALFYRVGVATDEFLKRS
jgi:hypothetical protein